MGWVLSKSKAQGRARLVLLSIANHASATGGNVYCGLNRIASESLVHRATVIRAIQHLEEIGELLVYEHQGVQGRGGTTNRYEMPLVPEWMPPLIVGKPRLDPCGYCSGKRSHDATTSYEVVADWLEEVASCAESGRTDATGTIPNREIQPSRFQPPISDIKAMLSTLAKGNR
jgi:hypothetical protein